MENLEYRLSQYRKILKAEPELYKASEVLYEKYANTITKNLNVLTSIAIYVMAPVMYGFVEWVLINASKAGYKRLYFLARDSYSMYGMAKIIRLKLALPIELKYLYCSRYALRTAWYHLKMDESLKYICLGGTEVTFEKVMLRAGINQEKIHEFADIFGYNTDYKNRTLSYYELSILREKLKNNQDFLDMVSENAKHNFGPVSAYLNQEGLHDDIPYALVDSGWVGSMQMILTDLVNETKSRQHHQINGYYFGLYEYAYGVDKQSYHTYYFAPDGFINRKSHFANCLFECIYSSPEGMTIGYQRDEKGIYIPVLERDENPNREKILKTNDLLCEYAQNVAQPRHLKGKQKSIRLISTKLLSLFMGRPSFLEAQEFGNYVFCDDVIGENTQTVAAPLSVLDIRKNRFFNRLINMRKGGKKISESAWLQGSVVLKIRNPWLELQHVTFYRNMLYIRKQMFGG